MRDGKIKTHLVALSYEILIVACTREMGLAAPKKLGSKKLAQLFMLYWSKKVFIYSRASTNRRAEKEDWGKNNFLPTGWSHGLGPSWQDGKESECRTLHGGWTSHIFASLTSCGQLGPSSERLLSA